MFAANISVICPYPCLFNLFGDTMHLVGTTHK